jgi:hypothetical protein
MGGWRQVVSLASLQNYPVAQILRDLNQSLIKSIVFFLQSDDFL